MAALAMNMLRNAAIRNFRHGRKSFRFTASCVVKFQHMHDNEYGVMVHDPIVDEDVEVLRIINGAVPYCV